MAMAGHELDDLLECRVCGDVLRAPVTLSCGHPVCAHHLPCPCPRAHNPAPSRPRIPPDSPVRFLPARTPALPNPRPPPTRLSTDVVLANILALRPGSPDLLSHLRSTRTTHKSLLDELTCHICYLLFYHPVTTPCQHTFCAKCLQRSLDHSSACPICRQDLPPSYFQDQPLNYTILSIILRVFPSLYQDRAAAIEEDDRHARLNTPIFVCQLSFPGVPTILHFFEPRYRLMLRRCLESPNPRFGMVMSPKPGAPQTDYGTMLEIRSVQMLPDGRSMVETWGSHRFRILERGTLDGYIVGRVERIDDYPDEFPDIRSIYTEQERPHSPSQTSLHEPDNLDPTADPRLQQPPTNEQLIETCKTFLDRLQRGAAPWVVQRLSSTYGTMPSDPALFSFWVALILPIEENERAKLLPIRSARLRLMLVVHWIEQLNNNWYAWLSFVVQHGWLGFDGPLFACGVWVAMVLTFFRFIGWI